MASREGEYERLARKVAFRKKMRRTGHTGTSSKEQREGCKGRSSRLFKNISVGEVLARGEEAATVKIGRELLRAGCRVRR